MGCPEYDVLIAKYLDDALSEDEQSLLKLHLATCADCDNYIKPLWSN
jgi:anti-sigma factor RsiW